MVTKFKYGTLDAEKDVVACLEFEFKVNDKKLEADEYKELIDLAARLKMLQQKVKERISK